MSFEKLLESAKQFGNEDFVKDFESTVAEVNTTIQSTSERVKVLEGELEGSISKKNKLRDLIKGNTGLEEISEENFKGYLDGLKGKEADKSVLADNEKLTSMVSDYKSQLDEINGKHSSELTNVRLDNSFLGNADIAGINSSVAKGLVLDKLREGATFGDDGILFKDANGSTVLNDDGKPLSLAEKVEIIRGDSEYSSFFSSKRKKGGGKGVDDGDASKHGFKDLSKLSRGEKAKLMSEMSSEDYQNLVRLNISKGK